MNGNSIVGHANPVVRPATRKCWPVQLLLTGGAGLRFSVNSLSKNAHFHFKRTSAYRSVELHEARGEELIGLSVELAEDPNGGVQVRVLMDSNVVSGVTVVPLQQGGCCD